MYLCVHQPEWTVCAGNKGLAGIISNPVIANGVAGLATSATAQATVERFVLWTLRDTVCPLWPYTYWQMTTPLLLAI